MIAYKFTTEIGKDGKIKVPKYLKKYSSNSVEIIMLIPDKTEEGNDISNFYNLIEDYNKVEEPELNISEIYKTRCSH